MSVDTSLSTREKVLTHFQYTVCSKTSNVLHLQNSVATFDVLCHGVSMIEFINVLRFVIFCRISLEGMYNCIYACLWLDYNYLEFDIKLLVFPGFFFNIVIEKKVIICF